jgi:hypothetical protein
MARVIAGRDTKIADCEAKIAQLRTKLQARYEELATMQRLFLRSRLSKRAKPSIRHLIHPLRKLFANIRK